MHSRVRQTPERLLRQVGALLILLLLIGPLASVRPAPTSAQGEDATGELSELWSYEASDSLFNDPGVTNGVVLAASQDSVIHAVDSDTGEGLWQTSTLYLTSGPYMQVADGLLLTISDPLSLNAFDVSRDGAKERWSVELDTVPHSWQPTITEDGLVIVILESDSGAYGRIVALASEDGSEQWSVDVSQNIYGSGYLYTDGVVVVGMDEGLTGLDAASGDEIWQIDLDPTTVMMVAGGGAVYGAVRERDELFALDITSGDELWNVTAPTTFNLPVAYGDGLFFVNYPGQVDDERARAILALDAETGEERFTLTSLVGEVTSGIVRDRYFYLAASDSVAQDGAVEVYNLEDGALVARTVVDAMGMAVDGDNVYVASFGSDQNLLYGYGLSQQGSDNGGDGGDSADDDTHASGNEFLDLAAMTLTPWDLADAGLDNYGHGYSEMIFADAIIANLAADRDMPEDEVRDLLEDAGLIRAYYAYFSSPAEEEDVNLMVVSYALEFADADGAADAWDFLEDEADNHDAEDLDGFDDYGDASEATFLTGEDPETGDPFAQIDATVLIDNLHIGVSVVDWTGEEPEQDLLTELLGYAVEGAEAGLDTPGPVLSNQAVRFAGDSVASYHDTYVMRDGEVIWFSGETADTADSQLDAAEEAGQAEEYRAWLKLASWSDDPVNSVWYYLTLRRFEDARAAEEWLSARQAIVENDEAFTDVELETADYGDAGFTYTALSTDGITHLRGITFQIGEVVASIDLSGPLMPTDDAIRALADAQLTCLEDEGCAEPIEIPADIADYIADAEAGAAPDEETPEADETPAADDTPEAVETPEDEEEQPDGGPVIYEGQMYGFAVEYNANDWRMVPEDDPAADDDDEWIQFLNDVSTVWMVATQDFAADELGDCVEHYVDALGWTDAWELEPLDELTEDDERAYVSYTMVDSLFGMTGYLYVECRPIDSDTVLMITHFAGTDAEGEVPEGEVAAVEDLMNGIVIYENE